MHTASTLDSPPERLSRLLKQRVILAAALLVALSLVFMASLLLHIAGEQDRQAADQASALVHADFARRKAAVARDLKDYAAWGEAYQHLHATTDVEWAFNQRNLGPTLFADLGYDALAVIGPAGTVTYAVVEGRLSATLPDAWEGGALDTLVEAARAAAPGEAVPAVGVLRGRTVPLVIAASAITTGGSVGIVPTPGPPSVLVFATMLTPDRLSTMGTQSFVQHLRTTASDIGTKPFSTMTIPTPDGRGTVAFAWDPERPGTAILWAVLPWLLVAGLAFSLLITVMVRRLLGAALVIERKSHALSEAHRQMEHAALHDAVTHLPNRIQLDRFLSNALLQPGRSSEVAVVFIDLDRFKPINDALGHRAGDIVLKIIADRLLNLPGPDELVARVGGDEFVLVTKRSRTGGAVEQLCEAVRETVRTPMEVEGTIVRVGLSMGVAFGPADGRGAAELLRHADVAMYAAKVRGGDGYVVFSPSLASAANATSLRDMLAAPRSAPASRPSPIDDGRDPGRLRSAV